MLGVERAATDAHRDPNPAGRTGGNHVDVVDGEAEVVQAADALAYSVPLVWRDDEIGGQLSPESDVAFGDVEAEFQIRRVEVVAL